MRYEANLQQAKQQGLEGPLMADIYAKRQEIIRNQRDNNS